MDNEFEERMHILLKELEIMVHRVISGEKEMDGDDTNFIVDILVDTFMATITQWIDLNRKGNPSAIAELFTKLALCKTLKQIDALIKKDNLIYGYEEESLEVQDGEK